MLGHNAGYKIFDYEVHNVHQDGVEECIVIGKMPGKERYVTWCAEHHPNGNWDYFWGHYFEDDTAARIDYHKRLLSYYDAPVLNKSDPNRVIGLRWFSILNEWMDCVVFVQEKYRAEAKEAISAGIDEFWEENNLCYGDCIDNALSNRGIPFVIEYEDEALYANDEDWECHLKAYAAIGIDIENVI